MTDSAAWETFKQKAAADAALIEGLIIGVYEELLSEGDHCLDGGAHRGFHTLPMSRVVGPTGRVVAVDANREIFELLCERLTKKQIENVETEFAALQDDPERRSVNFFCSENFPARSGINRSWDLISPGTVDYDEADDVPATTIDKLAEAHALTKLRFIKLDLEGGEFPALRGAIKSLETMRPVIVTEHSEKAPEINGFTVGEYFDFFQRLDYTPMAPNGEAITASDPFPFWYAFLVPSEKIEFVASLLAFRLRKTLEEEAGDSGRLSAERQAQEFRQRWMRLKSTLQQTRSELNEIRAEQEQLRSGRKDRGQEIASLKKQLREAQKSAESARREIAEIKKSWQYRPLEKLLKPWKYRS